MAALKISWAPQFDDYPALASVGLSPGYWELEVQPIDLRKTVYSKNNCMSLSSVSESCPKDRRATLWKETHYRKTEVPRIKACCLKSRIIRIISVNMQLALINQNHSQKFCFLNVECVCVFAHVCTPWVHLWMSEDNSQEWFVSFHHAVWIVELKLKLSGGTINVFTIWSILQPPPPSETLF